MFMIPVIKDFYKLPLRYAILLSLIVIVLWGLIMNYIDKKDERLKHLILTIMLILSIFLILELTVLDRPCFRHEVILKPFISFETAKTIPETYRALIMNIILFVPFGMTLPYVISSRRKKWWFVIVVTMVIACMFSICIESLQYIYYLGISEVDDVLFNTLGAMIGSLSYTMTYFLSKKQ